MTLESLEAKIKTVSELKDIVSTMKMLSSVSVGVYEKAEKSVLTYQRNIEDAFSAIFLNYGDIVKTVRKKGNNENIIAVMIGTDTGLVGGFNKEIAQWAFNYLDNFKFENVSFISIGKKMTSFLKGRNKNILAMYPVSNTLKEFSTFLSDVLAHLETVMRVQKWNKVLVFYQSKNGRYQEKFRVKQLLPFPKEYFKNQEGKKWNTRSFPLVLSKKENMLSHLEHEYITLMLMKAVITSLVAEHTKRMMNMQQAEKNIKENLEALNLVYQQERQTVITDELIDIVSGAESLKKKISF